MIRDKNENKLDSTEHREYSFKFGCPRCSDAVEIIQRTRSFNPTGNSHLYIEQVNDCNKIRSIPYRKEYLYEEKNHDQAVGSIGF